MSEIKDPRFRIYHASNGFHTRMKICESTGMGDSFAVSGTLVMGDAGGRVLLDHLAKMPNTELREAAEYNEHVSRGRAEK